MELEFAKKNSKKTYNNFFLKRRKKIMKKNKKKEKRPKINLILSYINHTFFILDPQIGPQAFRHAHCT